jgi:hypothetical protein
MPDSLPPLPSRGPTGRLTPQFRLPEPLAQLRHTARWVGWKWTQKPDGGWDKPPFRADYPDFHASTTNPKSWVGLDVAERSLEAGLIDGIGYVIREDAENVYLDLDDCRDPTTGEVAPWALALIEECDSYTELTPSGRGFRIIGTHGGFLSAPIDASYRLPCGGHGEVYFRGLRYVTMTGLHLAGTPTELREIGGAALELLARAGRKLAPPTQAKATTPEQARAPLRDVLAALSTVRNDDLEYDDWLRVGLATFAATSGEGEGLEAWMRWSAKSAKHHDHECLRAWNSFHKSPPRSIGFGSLAYLARAANPLWTAPSWRGEAVADEPQETAQEGAHTPAQTAQPAAHMPLIYAMDVRPALEVNDFVEGLMTEESLSVTYGPSNCGKTFFMSDLALHVATGRAWRGREIEAGGVIYCALEGSHGISNRVAAWIKENGLEGFEIPFAIVPVAMNLLDPNADREKLAATIAHAAEQMGVPVKLVVIDTLSRAMAGGNENAPDDMGALVNSADYIRQQCNAHIAFIHHSGKDQAQGARGHSLLRAATDTEIEISRADSESPSVAKVTKQREMEIDGTFGFTLKVVELGTNRRGKPVTSCVVEPMEKVPVAKARQKKLPPPAANALKALYNCLVDRGATRAAAHGVPEGVRTITETEWRSEFYAITPGDGLTQNARRMAFTRAVERLTADKIAGFASGLGWLVVHEGAAQ